MRSDTRKLLTTGLAITGFGALNVLLVFFVFGGLGRQGPHTNAGWLCLMFALGCMPTGLLTLLLAGLKLVGDRSRSQ